MKRTNELLKIVQERDYCSNKTNDKGEGNLMIVVEGTVGAGKSTLSHLISDHFHIPVFEELGNPDTEKLLDRFYGERSRWSFTTQIHFATERWQMIKHISEQRCGVLDRSIFGDQIFAKLLSEDGSMTPEEYRIYEKLLAAIVETTRAPDLLVYLQCDTERAKERIDRRGRGLESKVEMKYWERLNEKYEAWYQGYQYSPKILLGVNHLDFANNEEDRESVLSLIGKALKDIQYLSVKIAEA
ncbi:deoxynucleoside kinase [Domibacillus indicus]|uniref:deoxynucleoside kinase n=1 Tax=Domibacillus indicus TaxID=1437523 RepID=UPI00203E9C4F|nr:deoxynucleoside kinase [Domibacillus indicus]MCM3791403.1 deoxynucleoside kinase [Domibacillus indicus]